MTTPVPAALLDGASEARRACTERWWSTLPDAARRDLARLYDPALEDSAHVSGEDRETAPPIELHGRFVDPEDARDDAMWRQDLIEYLNAHPEIDFFLGERRFHICRAHAEARRVLATGGIPHDFACPLQRRACPFARALSGQPGRAIVLSVHTPRRG